MDRGGKAISFLELISQHEFHGSLSDILEDGESEYSKASNKWSYILKGCFCAILEDTKSQLMCLNGFSNRIKTLGSNLHLPDSLEELNKLKQNGKGDTIVYAKLDVDRKYVYKVMNNTYLELIENNTFCYLNESIDGIVRLENYRYNLLIDKDKNKITHKGLVKQMKMQRNRIKAKLNDTDMVIKKLKKEIDDAQPMSQLKLRYTENWQLARIEQHNTIIANKENIPRSSITHFRQKYEQEVIVHCEVQRLLKIQINETLSKIEVFMKKYDKDLENMELKIQINKNTYNDMRNNRMGMEEMVNITLMITVGTKHGKMLWKLLEERYSLIKNWTKFKEEREIARRYAEKMSNAAYTIQAWWRGILVRLHLGPYAEKTSKKKKKRK